MTIYIDPEGKEHYSLPTLWNNTSPITWEYLERHGWTKEERQDPEPEPEPERERIYSKRLVYEKLEFLGIWKQVQKMILDSGCSTYWSISDDLRLSHPKFSLMCEQVEAILPNGMTYGEFLAGCEDLEKERLVYGREVR